MHETDTFSLQADLIVVFIQHNDYLCHVVEFSHSTQVVHCLLPLLVLLLLIHTQKNMDANTNTNIHRINICKRHLRHTYMNKHLYEMKHNNKIITPPRNKRCNV